MANRRFVSGLLGWIWLSLSAGLVGARFQPGAWYDDLVKPDWTPPGAVFPLVWTTLYVLMGVAAFRVWWRHGFRNARLALGLFVLQLVLNAAWSWLFFGLHAIGAAFAGINLLWATIVATFLAFRPRDVLAARLLLPYLIWVGFAAVLNFTIWRLNSGAA
jgi:tryptophan-rich sensory protein